MRVDSTTGVLIGLDCEAYESERDARPPVPGYVPDLEPGSDALAPIEGVTLEQCASVQAGIARHAIAPAGYDAFATSHGVPAGRWSAINGAWQARIHSDWKLGAKYGEALQAAMSEPDA